MTLTVSKMSKRINKLDEKKPFTIFRKQINVDGVNLELYLPKLEAQGKHIFQQPGNNDKKRRQLHEIGLTEKQKQPIGPISNQLRAVFEYVGDGEASLSPFSVLQSLPGCIEQRLHRDFNYILRPLETIKSFLIIVALQDDTKLVVRTKRGKRQVVVLNKGDVFIGRGDLIHAGSGYEIMNIRLHWYVDYPDNKRDVGDTYFYDELTESTTIGDYYENFHKAAIKNLEKAVAGTKRKSAKKIARSMKMKEMHKKFKS